ncbi:MAG: hypothetical protein A2W22_01170 [Candidatus Levybacteria bacterium RBG_16_35_11]|nr:MAG: hypothetical protein A2W22_01170 [Candidatus Levybacteria bacterium RBG_16_35_11]
MKSLKKSYLINTSPFKIWKGLTIPKEIEKWTGSPAVMDEREGTNFKLWDGDIFGKNKEMIKNKKIVQEWYSGNWDKPSIVTLLINNKDGKSEVELIHDDIPDNDFESINQGWDDYYFNPLKEYLERSAFT